MKILTVSNLYPPHQIGGYEIACHNVSKRLRAMGHSVTILTSPSHTPEKAPNESKNNIIRNLRLHIFGPYLGEHEKVTETNTLEGMVTNFTNTANLLEAIDTINPDCVYLFNTVGIGGLALIDILNALDIPWVLHLMDRTPEIMQSGFSKPVLALFNAHNGDLYNKGNVISMSQHLIDEITEMIPNFNFNCPVTIIPGWVDTNTPIIERDYNRKNHTRFVSAGAIHPHKGIDIILEASRLLKDSGIRNFTVDIYGSGLISHYVNLCKQYNICDIVNFKGSRSQEELINIYKESDSFLFPTSEREPFGFAPIEAAASGCIPIITNRCGAAERLVNAVHCIKIEKSSQALFNAMKDVIGNKLNLKQMGLSTQILTREDLSFKHCVNQIELVLASAIARKANSTKKRPNWTYTNLAFLKNNLANQILSS